MKRTHLVSILVFVAGLGLGYFVRSLGIDKPQGTDMHAADWAAIEKLHKADVEATIKQDPSALTTLWSDDGANFGFAGPPVHLLWGRKRWPRPMRKCGPTTQNSKY